MYILQILIYIMIIIDVTKEKSLESALRTYKHKVQKVKQVQELRDRQVFVKPSVKKRTEKLKAIKSGIKSALNTAEIKETQGGLTGRLFYNIETGLPASNDNGSKKNVVEFLGFSRIDGNPMLKAYRQANTAGQFNYFSFDEKLNTFGETQSMAEQVVALGATALGGQPTIELVSALEDHIPGFTSNWTAASGAMTTGRGYIVRGSSGNTTFAGVPNNGNITNPEKMCSFFSKNFNGE